MASAAPSTSPPTRRSCGCSATTSASPAPSSAAASRNVAHARCTSTARPSGPASCRSPQSAPTRLRPSEATAQRCRYRRGDDQHLPLRDLPAHSRRDSSRGKGGLMERRVFLQVAGTVGAGLVIGFRLPDRHGVVPFAPNAWLRVDTDGAVTVTVDKSEMGEGNHTALAMIVAEELEADWSKVKIG